MQRDLGGPLFALALALWGAAFTAGQLGLARADGASFARGFMCFASGVAVPDAHTGLPGHKDGGRDACALCQACCGGLALLAARPGQVGLAPVHGGLSAWTVADRALPTPRRDHSWLARAPPLRS